LHVETVALTVEVLTELFEAQIATGPTGDFSSMANETPMESVDIDSCSLSSR